MNLVGSNIAASAKDLEGVETSDLDRPCRIIELARTRNG